MGFGARGPAVRLGLGDEVVPLAVPQVEALDVQLKRFPGADALDQPLTMGDGPLASVAVLPMAGATQDAGNAVSRQHASLELLANEELEMVWHRNPRTRRAYIARFTGVSTAKRVNP
jgi:hypothetical protein